MNILHTIKERKANWIGHILRRNCLLKHVTEGNVEWRTEVTERRGRRQKNYCITLMKQEDTGNWKRKHQLALCSELTLEEPMDMS